MSQCELPPCAPCPPPPYPPCPQVCPTPSGAGPGGLPPQPCRPKPIMRGLHWAQTKSVLIQALVLSALAGGAVFVLIGNRRKKAYADFYSKAEFDEWADEMAKKGHFQAVPSESAKK